MKHFVFRRISESDYGIYEIKVWFHVVGSKMQEFNLTLAGKEIPELSTTVITASIIVAVLLIGIIGFIVMIRKSSYLKNKYLFIYLKFLYKEYFTTYIEGSYND